MVNTEKIVLTEEQLKNYNEQGYVIFKNLISKELVEEIKKRCKDVCEGKVDKGVINIAKERFLKNVSGQYAINKIQDFCYDEVFKKYTEHDGILDVVEAIIGSDLTVINAAMILKPPNNSVEYSEHPVHQDAYYFPYRPIEKMISVWTALTDVTPKNGCLYIIPGSHKNPLFPHKYPHPDIKNVGYLSVPEFENHEKVDLIMHAGDTVFFHPLLLHGSYNNKSQELREAINIDYCNSFVEIYDFTGTNQEHLSTEFEDICMKKTGKCHTYIEVFQMKSKCVRGKPGNFNTKLQGLSYF